MITVSIITILFGIVCQSQALGHDTVYRQIYKIDHDEGNHSQIQSALRYIDDPNKLSSSRRSQMTEALTDPIRISVYFDPDTISTSAGFSIDQIDYIKRITAGAVNFYQKWVQVIPVEGQLSYFGCSSWFGEQYDPDSSIKCVDYDLQCGQVTGTLSQCI